MEERRLVDADAVARLIVVESLVCLRCGAANRPGVIYVEIIGSQAVCTVCGKPAQ